MWCINAITRLDFQLDFFYFFLFLSIIVRNGNQSSSSPTCTQNADYVINVGESGSDFPSAAFRYQPPWWLSRLFYWIKKRLWRFLLIHRTEKGIKKPFHTHKPEQFRWLGLFYTTSQQQTRAMNGSSSLIVSWNAKKRKKVGGNFIFPSVRKNKKIKETTPHHQIITLWAPRSLVGVWNNPVTYYNIIYVPGL